MFTFKSLREGIVSSTRTILDNHTVYRRNPAVEPAWLAGIRGTVALAGLAAIFAFGARNAFVKPMRQFQGPLPKRPIPVPMPYETGFPDNLYGAIWFKRVVGEDAYMPDPFEIYGDVDKQDHVLGGFAIEASLGDIRFPCDQQGYWRRDLYHLDTVDLGISWNCSELRKSLAYSVLDGSAVSPIIQLRWASSSASDPILRGHVSNAPIWEDHHLWMENFGDYLLWNVTFGTTARLSLGRRVIRTRPGTFLDMLGVKQKPKEIIGYPVVSATFASMGISSQTTIEISPSFGGFYYSNVDAWEEYLEDTVLEGLAKAGTASSPSGDAPE
ncbi:hypothetical protein FRC01_002388 [Tulasnella sp. 417]|nr:hypothetical protein FRC01_002388 [Tulasnella sp. 417]